MILSDHQNHYHLPSGECTESRSECIQAWAQYEANAWAQGHFITRQDVLNRSKDVRDNYLSQTDLSDEQRAFGTDLADIIFDLSIFYPEGK